MSRAYSLVIETSTPHASLARVGEGGVIDSHGFSSDRNHNAMLFEPMEALLGQLDCREIGVVIVGSGPGSYSGTRVGIAAAQGVAMVADCPAVAVPSILAVPSAVGGARCLAIGDARRGSYWTAMGCACALESDPALCDAAGLEFAVAAAVAAGVPVVAFEDPSRFPLSVGLLEQVRLEFPHADLLWAVWNGASTVTRDQWSAALPQPLYLKPPHITPGKDPCLVRESFQNS